MVLTTAYFPLTHTHTLTDIRKRSDSDDGVPQFISSIGDSATVDEMFSQVPTHTLSRSRPYHQHPYTEGQQFKPGEFQ